MDHGPEEWMLIGAAAALLRLKPATPASPVPRPLPSKHTAIAPNYYSAPDPAQRWGSCAASIVSRRGWYLRFVF